MTENYTSRQYQPSEIDLYTDDQPKPNGRTVLQDPLPYLGRDMPLRDREWLIAERMPMRNVTLLSGDGGVGKTVLLMQLAVATVLGKEWLGMRPTVGPVLYLGAEDDADELRRRFENIAKHYGATWQDLFDAGLRTLSFAGADALLGKPDRDSIIVATPLLARVRQDVIDLRPKLFIVDPAADVFAGKEIDRAQVRQFITMLRGIGITADCAVILAAHPSLSGMREGTGLSGSTAWGNSVRARFYLTRPKANGDNDDAPDSGLRVLEVKKNNYGPMTASLPIRWENGVFVLAAKDAFDQTVAEAQAEEVFMMLLRRFTAQGRNVSDKTGTSYAPARFVEQAEARAAGLNNKALTVAMDRLFTAGRIKVVTEGPPSHPRTRLAEAASTATSTDLPPPSTDPKNPSTGVCVPPPSNPPPGGSGLGAVESPPAPPGKKGSSTSGGTQADGLPPDAKIVGSAPPGERCFRCGKASGVKLIRRRKGEPADQMHIACAAERWAAEPREGE
jgi:RecA-family ATPase